MNELLNAIAGLTNTIYQDVDRKKRMAADAELRSQQIDLQLWQQQEMNKFSKRTDFENFKNDYDKDFAAKFAEYNTNKGDKAYTSNYAASQGNSMFDQLKANGEIALSKIIDQQQISYANVKDRQTLDAIKTQPASQQRTDQAAGIIQTEIKENRISREQGYDELNKLLNQDQYEMALQDINKWQYNNPGATMSDFDKHLDELDSSLDAPVIEGITGDRKTSLDAAKKVARQQVYDRQKATNESVFKANTDILLDVALGKKPQGQLISELKSQISFIEAIPDLQIGDQDKRSRLKELYSLLDSFGEKPTKTGETNAKVTAFSTLINNDLPTYIEASKTGTQSATAEGAVSAYASRTAFLDKYIKIGEEYGIEANKIKLDYSNKFIEQIQREYNHNPKVVSIFNQVKDILKEYGNKKNVNYDELEAEVQGYVWDVLFDTDMSKLDPEEIVKQTQSFIENITAKELTLQKIRKDGFMGLTGDYNLPKALNELANNDYAWTDDKGIQHFNDKAYDVVVDKVIPEQVEALYSVGVKGHLKVEDAPVSETGYDIDLNPVYKDDKGNKYTFKSIDENSYEIYMNGQKYATSEEVDTKRKNIGKDERKKINAERDRIKKERKELKTQAKQFKEEDKKERMELAKSYVAPSHIDQNEWQKMDLSQRAAVLVQYRTLYPEEYKELLKGANK